MDTEVLVVGAGPTGLVLALWLARLGIQVRIIDKAAGPGGTSRALAVQARTLELYRQLGFADEVVHAGLEFSAANLWASGARAAHVEFGRFGVVASPYPYGLIYPQDEHERFLIERLEKLDVRVERTAELLDFEEVDGQIVARLQDSTCKAAYLAGCDGARSTVRERLGISYPGGTYEHLFYVADVEASGPMLDHELHVSIDESDFAAVFPLKDEGRVRLIGTIRPGAEKKGEQLGWKDVSANLLQRLRIDVPRVNWFSTYHVHHRVAARFQQGRVFLLGDAAHIHSPVGGQGMNTGIGAVDVRGVAEEKDAPLLEARRDAVVHVVGREPVHAADIDAQPLQEVRAHVLPAQLLAFLLCPGADGADQPDPAFVLQGKDGGEVALVDRDVQLVVQQRAAGVDVRDVEEVLVRSAWEADAEALAHGGTCAIASGEISGLACRVLQPRHDLAVHFLEVEQLGRPLDAHVQFFQPLDEEALVLVLRIDEPVGIGARDHAEPAELDVRRPGAAGPEIRGAELESRVDNFVRETELAVELQRPR